MDFSPEIRREPKYSLCGDIGLAGRIARGGRFPAKPEISEQNYWNAWSAALCVLLFEQVNFVIWKLLLGKRGFTFIKYWGSIFGTKTFIRRHCSNIWSHVRLEYFMEYALKICYNSLNVWRIFKITIENISYPFKFLLQLKSNAGDYNLIFSYH